MTNEIVAGTDGSAGATHAVVWAAHEAARQGVPLRVVHALPKWTYASPPGSRHPEISMWWRSEARRLLQETVAEAERETPGIVVRSVLAFGDPGPVLLSETDSAEMIVVGHGGLGEMRGLLLGSVALRLAGRTPCPLVVVGHIPATERGEILVGTDGSPGSRMALRFAFEAAERSGALLRVMHVWSPGVPLTPDLAGHRVADTEHCARVLADAVAPWRERHPAVKVQDEIAHGHPVQLLAAASTAADLLVVGSRGLGGFSGLVLGSVGHGVLHHARCPTVIVPAHTEPAELLGDSGG